MRVWRLMLSIVAGVLLLPGCITTGDAAAAAPGSGEGQPEGEQEEQHEEQQQDEKPSPVAQPSLGHSEQQEATPAQEQQAAGAAGEDGSPADKPGQDEGRQQEQQQPGSAESAEAQGQKPSAEQQAEPPAEEHAAQQDAAQLPADAQEHAPAGSRRPRRSAAANWMRHLASDDFIVDEPLLHSRRSQQVGDPSCACWACRGWLFSGCPINKGTACTSLAAFCLPSVLICPCLPCVPALQSEGSEQPLRFRVSLGSGGAAQGAEAPAVKPKPKGWERTERLQQKYGLPAEAARRLVPLDRDYAPSGVLLRDICCALLRVAAGRTAAAAAAGEQPRAAKLQSEENEVSSRLSCRGGPSGLVYITVPDTDWSHR